MAGMDALCRTLKSQQWPACLSSATRRPIGRTAPSALPAAAVAAVRAARASTDAPRQRSTRRNTLMLVSMPCAFADNGANFRGALYDERRVLNAQHRSATPRFARGAVARYPIAAVGLTPYGHLADAHFYASTAPWVLQLLHLLPAEVPIRPHTCRTALPHRAPCTRRTADLAHHVWHRCPYSPRSLRA